LPPGLILARTEHQRLIAGASETHHRRIRPDIFRPVGVAVNSTHLNPFNPLNQSILLLAGGFILVAIVRTLVSGLGVLNRTVNRWVMGSAWCLVQKWG